MVDNPKSACLFLNRTAFLMMVSWSLGQLLLVILKMHSYMYIWKMHSYIPDLTHNSGVGAIPLDACRNHRTSQNSKIAPFFADFFILFIHDRI
jgi:hypothetical protein